MDAIQGPGFSIDILKPSDVYTPLLTSGRPRRGSLSTVGGADETMGF